MKKIILISIFVTIYSSLFAQSDLNIFQNYRIPDVSYRVTNLSMTFGGNETAYNANQTGSSTVSVGDFNKTDISWNMTPGVKFIRESEEKQSYLNFAFPIRTSYLEYRFIGTVISELSPGHFDYSRATNRDIRKSAYLTPVFDYNQRTYNNSNETIFFTFSAQASLNFEFYYSTNDFKESELSYIKRKNYEDYKFQNYSLGFGFGFGKLRDVTSVINALRFQDRLKTVNVINEDLPADVIHNIASQFSSYDRYKAAYDRPNKYFWNDMEKQLSTANIPLETASSYSKLYVFESLSELKYRRMEGQIISFSGNLKYTKAQIRDLSKLIMQFGYGEGLNSSYYEITSESILPGIVIEGIFSHQKSLHSQTRGKLVLESRTNISDRKSLVNLHGINGELGYDYEITDQIVFQLTNYAGFNVVNRDISESIMSNNFNPKLSVFLEDQLSIDLNYNFIYQENTLEAKPKSITYYSRDHRVFLGLNYFFDRALN